MIEVRGFKKTFGSKIAVDGVSFTVRKGEVLGFLGPNGAGKSTTMRMLAGFLIPDAGTALVDGKDIRQNPVAAKSRLGYLPENAPSYPEMQVVGFLKFCGAMRGLSGAALERAVDRSVDMCFLGQVRRQTIDTLSKGYRHRVGLAQAILHDPPALVLDEPTDGLDPNQKHEVRQLIRRMGESKAIVFSTHILEEVEAACTRAIIVDRGRVVANGTPAELRARCRSRAVCVAVEPAKAADCAAKLRELPGVKDARAEDGLVRVSAADPAGLHGLSARVLSAVAGRFPASEVWVDEGRLDEVFREITTGDTALAAQGK